MSEGFDLLTFLERPPLEDPLVEAFWNDPHISVGMLEAHLNPDVNAATRRLDFIERSVAWIADLFPPSRYRDLLDLGCGPGIYAERFAAKGYRVTGVDYSARSIDHARTRAGDGPNAPTYRFLNYLELDEDANFDIATLIYCDYCVLPRDQRRTLLGNVRKALRPGGTLVLDVHTPREFEGVEESTSWRGFPDGGFWNPDPHLCLEAFYRYDDARSVLRRTVVLAAGDIRAYNLWIHCFTSETLRAELEAAGFANVTLFGDVAGAPVDPDGTILSAVASLEAGSGVTEPHQGPSET